MNIPKKIHYCWFGRNPLPLSAQKCISSWRKFFPDHEIIEWNEDNFDVNSIPYTAQAYEAKKYAFVSDYARFKILYEHGGIYFDTDVEVIKPFDDILSNGSFMGVEVEPSKNAPIAVAAGLGIGAEAGNPIYAEIITFYSTLNFYLPDGNINPYAVVRITTDFLLRHGLKQISGIQTVDNIIIYPSDYFNPLDDATGRLKKTSNTHSIHWYSKTWMEINPWRQKISRLIHRIFGFSSRVRRMLNI